jgi:hypothetical protein
MVASLFVIMPIFIKKILKEEDLQYNNNNKEFNKDNYPYLSSPAGHIPESIIVKTEKPVQKRIIRFHLSVRFSLCNKLNEHKFQIPD